MILSIIAGAVALRSAALCYFTARNYFTTRRRFADLLVHGLFCSADVLIIYICGLFIGRGF